MKKEFYPFLDGFRAIGILMILGHHMCVGFNLYGIFDQDPKLLSWIYFKVWEHWNIDLSSFYLFLNHAIHYFKGILGVQIFFLISGFLIMRNLLENARSWEGIRIFWVRRFLRIYPAYMLMVVFSLLLYVWQNQGWTWDVVHTGIRYLLFLQNYFSPNIYLEHAWTLAIFEKFYLISPIFIFMAYRFIHNAKSRVMALSLMFLALMCLGAFTRYTYIVSGKAMLTWPIEAPKPYFTLIYHLWSLNLGCLLAVLHSKWKDWPKNKFVGCIFWAIGMTGYGVLFFMIDWGYYWGPWYLHIAGAFSTLCLFIAAFHGISLITRFKVVQSLGRYSYGIYIWHILVLSLWAQWLGKLPTIVVIAGALITSIGVGILSSVTVESYFLTLREKYKTKAA